MSLSSHVIVQGASAALVVILAIAGAAHARVLYVDDDAPPGCDGTTWARAFDDLQDALAAATSGHEIRVAAGTYTPAGPGGDRDATFELVNGVRLRGGYAGIGAFDPNKRNIAGHETVLSGDLNGDDDPAEFPFGPTFGDNSRHVVMSGDVDQTTVLEGFTITSGNGLVPGGDVGAGMFNVMGSPTVVNCIFTRNWAARGAAMYNNDGSSPIVARCDFIENVAGSSGAGMYNRSSNPVVTNCLFAWNCAEGTALFNGGGAIQNAGSSDPILIGSFFVGNAATGSRGGAIFNHTGCDPVITNCVFEGNGAEREGGAIYNTEANPVVIGCTFVHNSSNTFGGAVHNDFSSPSFSRCTFAGNTASSGGGVFVQAGSLPTLSDCAFTGNVAGFDGGGMYTNDSPLLTNCTFSGNRAGPFGLGGGIAVFVSASPTLASCILWGNSDGGGMDESAQIHVGSGAPTVRYSCIQGLDTFAGSGNIGDDPRFVDPAGANGVAGSADDNVRLRPDSPSIDTGDPDFVSEPGAMDLDGHARVLCDRVDMGAYEFGIGDADCDREVDLDDYLLWTVCMLGPAGGPYVPGCEVFDFDRDGHVDLRDFAGLQGVFGQ